MSVLAPTIIMIIGAGMAYLGYVRLKRNQQLEKTGTRIKARVIRYYREYDNDEDSPGWTYYPVVRFKDEQGEMVEHQLGWGYSQPPRVGHYKIIYEKLEDGYDIILDNSLTMKWVPQIIMAIGLIIAVVCAGVILSILSGDMTLS